MAMQAKKNWVLSGANKNRAYALETAFKNREKINMSCPWGVNLTLKREKSGDMLMETDSGYSTQKSLRATSGSGGAGQTIL